MRKTLEDVVPYAPPSTRGLHLHRNTNRWGMNPVAHDLPRWMEYADLSEYPEGSATGLREALARFHGLSPENFLIGNGSNEIYDLIFKTFLNPGEIVAHPSPSYSMYRHYALVNAAGLTEVPLGENFELDAQAFESCRADLIVLCTPNNPTGNEFRPEEIERVLNLGEPVVIDEAYAEFGSQNWIARIPEYSNLLVTRTFSKAHGLAGLRVGYVAASSEIIDLIHRARLPYNINALSQAIATTALENPGFMEGYAALIKAERPRWRDALIERGFHVWPSDANFLFVQVPRQVDRDALLSQVAEQGVLLRSAGDHERLQLCIRITIGTRDDLELLLSALDRVLS